MTMMTKACFLSGFEHSMQGRNRTATVHWLYIPGHEIPSVCESASWTSMRYHSLPNDVYMSLSSQVSGSCIANIVVESVSTLSHSGEDVVRFEFLFHCSSVKCLTLICP